MGIIHSPMARHRIRHRVEETRNTCSRAVLNEERKKRIPPFRHILDGGETLTIQTKTGKTYRFFLTPGPRTTIHSLKRERGWNIVIGPTLRRPGLHKLLWSLLAHAERASVHMLVHEMK